MFPGPRVLYEQLGHKFTYIACADRCEIHTMLVQLICIISQKLLLPVLSIICKIQPVQMSTHTVY